MRCVTFTACVLAVTACRSEDKPKQPPLPIDGITIVAPGAEPRRVLRYAFTQQASTPLELAMDIDLTTNDDLVLMPTLAMSIDLAVHAIDQVGNGTMKMSVAAAGARPRIEQQKEASALKLMDRQTALLAGLVIAYTVSPAGAISGSKVEAVGRDLSQPMQEQVAQLVQLSEQMAMALPDKPIGVGAIWKHRRTLRQNKLTLVTTSTIEVTAIDGDKVTFKGTTEMTGADQTLTEGSASAQVTAIRGTGSQSGTFDLGKAIVLGETRAQLDFEMIVDGQRRPMKFQMVTRIAPRSDTSPVPPDAGTP